MRRSFIVAYDLSDDRERSKICKVLESYGERVQRSVWLCDMPPPRRERLLKTLESMHLESGYVDVWPVAGTGQRCGNGALAPQPAWNWMC